MLEQQEPPGIVINSSPDPEYIYIGCPGIVIMPNGDYIASHSMFGDGTNYDQMFIFRSSDAGQSWEQLSEVKGQWWSTLFLHNEALYLMGTSCKDGFVAVRRSEDGGKAWSEPRDRKTGLLADDAKYHTAPVPVVVQNGRVWRGMEERWYHSKKEQEKHGLPKKEQLCIVLSAPEDADLLDADNWTWSNRLRYDASWPGSVWLEGNVVVTPEGKLVNILRTNFHSANKSATRASEDHPRVNLIGEKASIVWVSDDGKELTHNPDEDLIDFPGGDSKFTIRFDDRTQRYWSLTNYQRDAGSYRNILALTSSADLKDWKVESIVLHHDEPERHAFQYVDWRIENDDIIAVARTAWKYEGGTTINKRPAHNANYLTFHRIENFRTRTCEDAPLNTSSEK